MYNGEQVLANYSDLTVAQVKKPPTATHVYCCWVLVVLCWFCVWPLFGLCVSLYVRVFVCLGVRARESGQGVARYSCLTADLKAK